MAEAPQMRNLRKAQFVRSQRRELRERIQDGRLDPIALVRGGGGEWETQILAEMPYEKLLLMVNGIGDMTCGDLIVEFGVSGKVQLGALSFAQRATLADLLHVVIHGEAPITAEAQS